MAKNKKIEGEFQLPEAMIQHIQSFMSGNGAAQTTILSKSWNSAWLTRPNIDLYDRYFINFVNGRYESSFSEFVNKTVQRYENLNLKIERLRFNLTATDSLYGIAKDSSYSTANELILKAIKMGAIDLHFNNYPQDSVFTFPNEVLGSENLIRLSVGGCKIVLGDEGKVGCSRLESLSLENMYLKGDIIWNIILSCPLIEKLSVSNCRVCDSDVVSFTSSRRLVWSPFIEFCKGGVGSVVHGLSMHVFHKLKCLLLSWVNLGTLFFNDFSSKFPCLKDLSIRNCCVYKEIQISSPTLECIEFKQEWMLRAKFDVPRLRNFSYIGSNIPDLLFITTTNNWKSNISILRCSPHSTLWFLKLNKLLTNLSQSKVFLFFKIRSAKSFQCAGNLQGLPKPEVEDLTIDVPYSICPTLFDCLFRCCRPIYVTQYWFLKSYGIVISNHEFMEFVYKRVVQQVRLNLSIANQSLPDKYNLEEVHVEFFDEAMSMWRPRLLDASTSAGADEQRIRLHLRWGR